MLKQKYLEGTQTLGSKKTKPLILAVVTLLRYIWS